MYERVRYASDVAGVKASPSGRRRLVRRQAIAVVQGQRLVLLYAAVLPVPQHRERQSLVGHVVHERPPEPRIGLSQIAIVVLARRGARAGQRVRPDDLGDRPSLLNKELTVCLAEAGIRGGEAAPRSSRDRREAAVG